MKTLLIIFLALIALFTGGCSLFFLANLGRNDTVGAAPFWGSGLMIAALSIWAISAISRPRKPQPPKQNAIR